MSQAVFEAGQERFLIARFDVDDAARGKASLGDGRGEQVLSRHAPQDFALGPRRDPGGEERGRGSVDGAISTPCDLMQGAER